MWMVDPNQVAFFLGGFWPVASIWMVQPMLLRQAPQNAIVALDATAETGNLQRTLQAFEMLPVLGQTQVGEKHWSTILFSEDHVISNFDWSTSSLPTIPGLHPGELWSNLPNLEIQKKFRSSKTHRHTSSRKAWNEEYLRAEKTQTHQSVVGLGVPIDIVLRFLKNAMFHHEMCQTLGVLPPSKMKV